MIELTPTTGRSLADVQASLQQVKDEAYAIQASGLALSARWTQWAPTAVRRLQAALGINIADRLIYTPHYFALLSVTDSETAQTQTNAVRETLTTQLAELIERVSALRKHWEPVRVAVVLDTNILLHTASPLQEVDWPAALQIADSLYLVIPMAVVDELDRLKRDNRVRGYARAALKTIEGLVGAPGERATIATANATHNHATTVEVLAERLDHQRLENTDSEIVSRAAWLAGLRCCDVYFATWDTGARFRAAAAEGVRVIRPPEEMERQD